MISHFGDVVSRPVSDGFDKEILSTEWNRREIFVHSFVHEIPRELHQRALPTTTHSLAQTFPLEFLGARASHFLSECRISRCTSWRVVTDLPWNNAHTIPCLMLLSMIADYL